MGLGQLYPDTVNNDDIKQSYHDNDGPATTIHTKFTQTAETLGKCPAEQKHKVK